MKSSLSSNVADLDTTSTCSFPAAVSNGHSIDSTGFGLIFFCFLVGGGRSPYKSSILGKYTTPTHKLRIQHQCEEEPLQKSIAATVFSACLTNVTSFVVYSIAYNGSKQVTVILVYY